MDEFYKNISQQYDIIKYHNDKVPFPRKFKMIPF